MKKRGLVVRNESSRKCRSFTSITIVVENNHQKHTHLIWPCKCFAKIKEIIQQNAAQQFINDDDDENLKNENEKKKQKIFYYFRPHFIQFFDFHACSKLLILKYCCEIHYSI